MEQGQAVYVQKVDGPGFIRFDTRVGKRTNLHCTSVGKILLAYGPAMYRKEFFANPTFARYTRKTIATAQELKAELEKVRQRGWALDDQEEELEVRCAAVPVFTPKGELLAALSVTGTVGQLADNTLPRTVELLQRAAARICNYAGARAEEAGSDA
jgi:DNA-binding IclR family transcriptional regulator